MKLSDNFTELTKNDMEQVSGGFLINILELCPLFRLFRPRDPEDPGKEYEEQSNRSSIPRRIFNLFSW